MKRSAGVTVSAVIAFLGSGAALLWGASLFLVGSLARAQLSQPPFLRYATYFIGILFVGFAAWGIASGVGLLRLHEWARLSLLVYSVLLLFVCLPGLIIFLVMPIPTPPNVGDPESFKQALVATRIFVAGLYGILISLATFWLWLFNTRTVKEQFKGLTTVDASLAHTSRRPISITIIAWYLLISACFFPMMLLFHFPIFLLGLFVKGWGATLIMLVMSAFQIVMGFGLLKLRPWARIMSICYFAFFLFNSFALVLIPGTQARFEDAQAEIQRVLGTSPTVLGTTQNPIHFPMWFALVVTLPVFGVLLWFIARSKGAFMPAPPPSEPLS